MSTITKFVQIRLYKDMNKKKLAIILLYFSEKRDEWDLSGQIAYEKACKKYGVIVSSSFYDKLRHATAIDLGYYGVGVAGAKAIAVAFCVSTVPSFLVLWLELKMGSARVLD